MNNTSQFADFLIDIVTNDLSQRNVVKISSFPSCYIYLGSHPERRGKNPQSGEEIIRKAGNDLRWYIPKYDDQFTEEQFLESLKRNNIQLITKEFSTFQMLLDDAKKLSTSFDPFATSSINTLPIISTNELKLLELELDGIFFWHEEIALQELLQKFTSPLLTHDEDHGLKIKENL